MPIQWETVERSQHDALPRRKTSGKDPEWDDVLNELEHTGNAIKLTYQDEKERGMLARSVGRRAAHRGFKVDIRHGEGFLSVTRSDAPYTPPTEADRANRRKATTG